MINILWIKFYGNFSCKVEDSFYIRTKYFLTDFNKLDTFRRSLNMLSFVNNIIKKAYFYR